MDAFDRTQPLNSEPEPDPAPAGRAGRWAAGVALAAILIGGGVAAGAGLAGGHSATPASATSSGGGQGAAGPGLALAAALGLPASLGSPSALGSPGSLGALSNTSVAHLPGGAHVRHAFAELRRCVATARQLRAAGRLAAARATLRTCLRRYLRLRLLLLGAVHGQLTVRTRTGFRTIAFERGIVESVSGSTVVVIAADQVTMTWHLISKTVVIRQRHKVGTGALARGERVLVIGPVVSGADDARLIVIRR